MVLKDARTGGRVEVTDPRLTEDRIEQVQATCFNCSGGRRNRANPDRARGRRGLRCGGCEWMKDRAQAEGLGPHDADRRAAARVFVTYLNQQSAAIQSIEFDTVRVSAESGFADLSGPSRWKATLLREASPVSGCDSG